jgi:hypothetical protein
LITRTEAAMVNITTNYNTNHFSGCHSKLQNQTENKTTDVENLDLVLRRKHKCGEVFFLFLEEPNNLILKLDHLRQEIAQQKDNTLGKKMTTTQIWIH